MDKDKKILCSVNDIQNICALLIFGSFHAYENMGNEKKRRYVFLWGHKPSCLLFRKEYFRNNRCVAK